MKIVPISLKINGYTDSLSVEMYQQNSTYYLHLIDDNEILIDCTDKKVDHSEHMFRDYLNNGNYIVFINTTGLEAGYYEMWFTVLLRLAKLYQKDSILLVILHPRITE